MCCCKSVTCKGHKPDFYYYFPNKHGEPALYYKVRVWFARLLHTSKYPATLQWQSLPKWEPETVNMHMQLEQ
jgi:hypothetical protein